MNAVLFLIRIYQVAVSPLLGCNCRFTPSCSHYAQAAVLEHGVAKGALMSAKRLLRCHPFAKPGHDPVPAKSAQ